MSAAVSGMPLIVVPADEPVQIAGSPQLQQFDGLAEVRVFGDRPQDEQQQVERARDADILINSRGQLKWPGHLLAQLPRLRMISTCSIGTDSIDLETARRQGIVVCNIPGRTAPIVAEHAFGLMLAVAKRAAFQTAELKAGRWTRMENIFLAGKTLGIVGAGATGHHMTRLAQAIGMEVLVWTYHPSAERAAEMNVRFVELDELLERSDVVSLHVKLTSESRHLLGQEELARMKPGSLLVNTSRGGVLDTRALVAALEQGRLAGAALDVFEQEPLPADDPILRCPHVVLTPHMADQTQEGMDRLNQGAVDNVLAYLRGRPQNVVT